MKKLVSKSKLINILMFMSFFVLAFYSNIYTTRLIDVSLFGISKSKINILWITFSLMWIFMMFLLLYLFDRKKRLYVYSLLIVIWNVILFAQICYVQQMGKFMIFSDLFVAGEGFHYIKSIFTNMSYGMLLSCFISLSLMGIVLYLEKDKLKKFKDDYKISKKVIISLASLVILLKVFSLVMLGSEATADSWQENYTPKNIYKDYTNPNTSMLISGIYEYNIRAVYKYFYNLFTLDKSVLKNSIDNYNYIYGKKYSSNEMTGIFKDKNVIVVMMESIDSWIVDQDTMPTLKKMMDTGINFTNRYSPFFNGGQTINSEFALNTGLYAISNKSTIFDINDVNYKYSLANMLKRNGYSVNSFHANGGYFYNRNEFHKLLGYTRHYSLLDMQKNGILDKNKNYYSDSEMIKDDYVFDLVAPNQKFMSFITTYSAHLKYSKDNLVYKTIDHDLKGKYKEEEYVYRTLAKDTDNFLKILLEKLEEKNMLEDTVIVLASDHYVYGYSDPEYVAYKKNVMNDRHLLQNTPFVIWSLKCQPSKIESFVDTADILPTLLNMLGIEFDPKNYIGDDVFSDYHDDFVWFSDGTYISSSTISDSEESILTKINLNIKKNKNILLTNYYGK